MYKYLTITMIIKTHGSSPSIIHITQYPTKEKETPPTLKPLQA